MSRVKRIVRGIVRRYREEEVSDELIQKGLEEV